MKKNAVAIVMTRGFISHTDKEGRSNIRHRYIVRAMSRSISNENVQLFPELMQIYPRKKNEEPKKYLRAVAPQRNAKDAAGE